MRLERMERPQEVVHDDCAVDVENVTTWDAGEREYGAELGKAGDCSDACSSDELSTDFAGLEGGLDSISTAACSDPSEKSPPFSLAGLSDPDQDRREREWLAFFAAFYEPLMKAMAREERDYDRRSDLVQMTFKRAHAAIVVNNFPLQSEEKALPWLRRIAHRLLLDQSDAERAHSRMLETHHTHLAAEEDLQLHAENALDRLCDEDVDDGRFPVSSEVVKRAVSSMPPRDQEIIRLRTQTDLEWADIATQVKMTDTAARQRFSRLRQRLRRLSSGDQPVRRRKNR